MVVLDNCTNSRWWGCLVTKLLSQKATDLSPWYFLSAQLVTFGYKRMDNPLRWTGASLGTHAWKHGRTNQNARLIWIMMWLKMNPKKLTSICWHWYFTVRSNIYFTHNCYYFNKRAGSWSLKLFYIKSIIEVLYNTIIVCLKGTLKISINMQLISIKNVNCVINCTYI